MSEKVLLTEEQALSIEDLKTAPFNWVIDNQINKKWHEEGIYYSLNDLDMEDFLKAFSGYEIKKAKLVDGDKIFYPKVGDIGTVKGDMVYWNDSSETEVDYTVSLMKNGEMKIATEEEIYWLEKLNRNSIPDFRKHDIYVDKNLDAWLLGKDITVDKAYKIYQEGDFLGVYPTDSFKSFY